MAGLEDTGHPGAPGNCPLGGSHTGRDHGKWGWPEQAATGRQEAGAGLETSGNQHHIRD